MNRTEKQAVIDALREKVATASIAVVTDFKGLKVEEMTTLRAKLREGGVDYQVVKNTLARIAFQDSTHDALKDNFNDNCAVALAYEDPVVLAKTLVDYAKENKKFQVRVASLEGKVLDSEQLRDLSKMPSKEELLAKVLGTMNAVPTNFVGLLANVPRSFLNVLTAVKDQKEAA